MKAKRSTYWTVAAAVALTVGTASTFGESLWVKAATVDMRSGKAAVYPKVATLAQGQEVTVVSRDSGWVQVTAAGSTGWINEVSLSKDKVSAGIRLGSGATAEMATGAGARGLQPGAEAYVSSKGIDKRPLEGLIALRNNIPPEEWVAFSASVHK